MPSKRRKNKDEKNYERKITQKQTEQQKIKTRQYMTEEKANIPRNRLIIQELRILCRTREKSKKNQRKYQTATQRNNELEITRKVEERQEFPQNANGRNIKIHISTEYCH